nr:hypothetical protein [uncultured Lachnoanaerobaculum sp.]
MNWLDCSDRMDRDVIKKDGTAVDIEYFMATHVPFRELEFLEFGDVESDTIHLDENQIYDQYIVNKANKHQMIIVRGTNGTGKSHLICWLHNRFVNDKDNYDENKEKVIFLQRLGNTVRGAVQQMLDEGLVQDPDLQKKFEKFCSADESQNKEEFKASIYSEYVRRTLTDTTNEIYKQVACKNIAAFLYDTRVQEYMLRTEGPIDKCYQMITSGAKTIVTDETETIFTTKDFEFPRAVANTIKKDAAEEVKSFYLYDLRDDSDAIVKLVNYLNHFTSGVIQSCANITSENARDLFVNLRKSLYKEGRNLTIFIEDFTSFSIVESELITALSVENGGSYDDLCRVTSVIGITDGYYDSFRDNFKDRVTKQIKVTEHSYGGDNFLLEMAARYINAIYADEATVRDWYKGSSVSDTMPISGFKPEFEWDSVEIGDQNYTLYPFNKKSLIKLYDKLAHKTPRNFLTHVIQHFFAQFADGMEFGDNWRFPETLSYISSLTLQPPYADSIENSSLSDVDKQRIKVLLNIWGNGTTEAGDDEIGGINKKFLSLIGLGSFAGVSSGITSTTKQTDNEFNESQRVRTSMAVEVKQPQLSQREKAFNRKKEDIESWFEAKNTLEYSSDYNKWVGNFAVQAIPWQDEGLPGDYVTQRLRNGSFVYIEDSKLDVNRNKAIVVLNRTSESRTILMGLNLFDYYSNWNFENAAYYQMVLINWIERSKEEFIKNLFGGAVGTTEHPVITWCLAIEYIQRLLLGQNLEKKTDYELLRILLRESFSCKVEKRLDKDWQDVLIYLENQKSQREQINSSLISGSKTIMGIVGERAESKVPFFRTSELLESLTHLRRKRWDISDEIASFEGSQYENIRKYLQGLYSKIETIVKSEKKYGKEKIDEFEALLGKDPDEARYLEVASQIQEFYITCGTAHEYYNSELKMKFDDAPVEQAKEAIGFYFTLKSALVEKDNIELLKQFSQRPIENIASVIGDLKDVEKFAKILYDKHSKMIGEVETIDPLVLESALSNLEELSDKISEMEVAE